MLTLYTLVTCSLEETRLDVLKQVVQNIKDQQNFNELRESLIVFDNASALSDEDFSSLFCDFKHVYRCNRNVGYWTALKWSIDNHENITGPKQFFYSIESDEIHHNMSELKKCEQLLIDNPNIGMVRTQEFEIANRHLYDKLNQRSDSRKYAWQQLINRFRNNEAVYFRHINDNLYATNFTAVVCGLSRLIDVKSALHTLSNMQSFLESDYQYIFDQKYIENAIYDGGLFNCKLSSKEGVVAGSRVGTWNSKNIAYRASQNDHIEISESYKVIKL